METDIKDLRRHDKIRVTYCIDPLGDEKEVTSNFASVITEEHMVLRDDSGGCPTYIPVERILRIETVEDDR